VTSTQLMNKMMFHIPGMVSLMEAMLRESYRAAQSPTITCSGAGDRGRGHGDAKRGPLVPAAPPAQERPRRRPPASRNPHTM